MSMFQNPNYHWRETCFVYFQRQYRPTLEQVLQAIRAVGPQYELTNAQANDSGWFESLTVIAPEAFSAMDICYLDGAEVKEDVEKQVKGLRASDLTPEEHSQLGELKKCNARLDILHFERLADDWDPSDTFGELFDPSALILVLEALSKLTHGIAVDPQSGMLL